MGKIIVFYNHKGGVGKTTLVHNLSFALADIGKRVLVVDADPQMNLTAAMYGLSTAMEYSLDEDSKWMDHVDKYISIGEHINTYLKSNKCEKCFFKKEIPDNEGVIDCISGSINLTEMESDLYSIIKNKNTYTEEIPHMFELSIREPANEYDFVLIDTSPSSSSIVNGMYIMSCDYFITPVSPTFFSLQAIDNLSSVLQNWINILGEYQSTRGKRGLSFNPQFLGIAVQLAKRFNSGAVNATGYSKSAESWINDVNESVKRFLQFANKRNMAISKEEFSNIFPGSIPFVIEKCCDFTPKLRDIAEKEGVPIILLTQEICKAYKNVDIEKKSSQYCRAFESISKSYREMARNLTNLT